MFQVKEKKTTSSLKWFSFKLIKEKKNIYISSLPSVKAAAAVDDNPLVDISKRSVLFELELIQSRLSKLLLTSTSTLALYQAKS